MTDTKMGQVAQDLEDFIRENFQVEHADEFFTRKVNLWEEGYVDSIGVVETISYLENTYSIQIPKVMLFDPKFTSVDGIAERIANLVNGQGLSDNRESMGYVQPDPGLFDN